MTMSSQPLLSSAPTSTGGRGELRIPFSVVNPASVRRVGEPVSLSVPLPQGIAHHVGAAFVRKPDGGVAIPCQLERLASWSDGSAKWMLARFFADSEIGAATPYELGLVCRPADVDLHDAGCVADTSHVAAAVKLTSSAIEIAERDGRDGLAVSGAAMRLPRQGNRLVAAIQCGGRQALSAEGLSIECLDARGQVRALWLEEMTVEQNGPVACVAHFRGRFKRSGGLRASGRITLFASQGLLRIEATLENPARARHPGGCWDLGDSGSVCLQGWRLAVHLADRIKTITWRATAESAERRTAGEDFSIHQGSSGGENWNSRNHVAATHTVTTWAPGYRIKTASDEYEGRRASPTLSVEYGDFRLSGALLEFWEKFPSGLRCRGRHFYAELWPVQEGVLHELQGGEHATRVVWLQFAAAHEKSVVDLPWVHQPSLAAVDSHWIAHCGVIPWFADGTLARNDGYRAVMSESLEGPRNFFAKREVIDEFGWRNFGDLWADHEAAHYQGAPPIVSHYNNQYDALHSFLIHYLLTADRRWWELADPLARHVMDIDVYHTDRDKSAYNGGMFWHTDHYQDAGLCTHRTYGRHMKGSSGGPSNEHAYASGLLLYYFLTGDRRARETVLRLADWIVSLDDGAGHPFGLVSDQPTGLASCTTVTSYHGPGRGAGNAIGVVLDAWQLEGGDRYLDFAHTLIQRTIHPDDNVAARDLNDFERRWSHSVYLLQLARYLHVTQGDARLAAMRSYVRECLLRYAEWSADHGLFSLDYPDQLEYPTETWAAQELRRGNVLLAAGEFCDGELQRKLRARGKAILERAWTSLMSFETRSCTRPLALALQQGYVESYLQASTASMPTVAEKSRSAWKAPAPFVPQGQHVRAMLRSPAALLGGVRNLLKVRRWHRLARQSWAAEKLRRGMAVVR